MVLFVGDNGTEILTSEWNNQSIKGSKGKSIEYGIHVPMLAYWPGVIGANSVNNSLVDFTDFFPTIADVAGIRRPTGLDGYSFIPTGLPGGNQPREWTYCYYDANHHPYPYDTIPPKEWAQDSIYKLYGNDAFYNFSTDVLETYNLRTRSLTRKEQRAYDKLKPVLDMCKK